MTRPARGSRRVAGLGSLPDFEVASQWFGCVPMLLWKLAALIRSRLWLFGVSPETPGVDLITGCAVRALDRVVHTLEIDVTVLTARSNNCGVDVERVDGRHPRNCWSWAGRKRSARSAERDP